jgi:hypothetical protein
LALALRIRTAPCAGQSSYRSERLRANTEGVRVTSPTRPTSPPALPDPGSARTTSLTAPCAGRTTLAGCSSAIFHLPMCAARRMGSERTAGCAAGDCCSLLWDPAARTFVVLHGGRLPRASLAGSLYERDRPAGTPSVLPATPALCMGARIKTLPRIRRAAFCFGAGGAYERREPHSQAYRKFMLKPGDSDLQWQVVYLRRGPRRCPRTPPMRSRRGAVGGTLTYGCTKCMCSCPARESALSAQHLQGSCAVQGCCKSEACRGRRIDALDVRTRLPS